MLIETLIFMSWRAAVGGEAIPQMMEETALAVYDRLAAICKEENCVTPICVEGVKWPKFQWGASAGESQSEFAGG